MQSNYYKAQLRLKSEQPDLHVNCGTFFGLGRGIVVAIMQTVDEAFITEVGF